MKRLSLVLLTLGLFFCSMDALAGITGSQIYVKNKDFTVENTIGIPDSVGWIEVQNLGIEFPPHNASSTESRFSGTVDKIYDYAQGIWHDVTFVINAEKGDYIDEIFQKFATGDNIRGSISVSIMNPKDSNKSIATFELQDLTLIRYSLGLSANVEHPDTLRFSFTVSPGYVKISTYTADDDAAIGEIANKITNSFSKFINVTREFEKLSSKVPLLNGFAFGGIEMQKNDTTVAGDKYEKDTSDVDNYGTIGMMFKMEPKSAPWINRVKDQYEGNIGGTLVDTYDGEPNVLGWHIESFNFPTFDSKSDAQLIQYVTIRIEKFIKK